MKENELLTKLKIPRKYTVYLKETREYCVCEVEACSEEEAKAEVKNNLGYYWDEAEATENDMMEISEVIANDE